MPHVHGRYVPQLDSPAARHSARRRSSPLFLPLRLPVAVVALALASCTTGDSKPPEFSPAVLPGPHGGARLAPPSTPPEDLVGVDTSKLNAREKKQWWLLVSQLYAPCADQAVSIAQCVKDSRPCRACVPAAELLAGKVAGGAPSEEVEAAYAIRFGPNVKKIEIGDSASRGAENAAITVVVWSDFECPHCRFAMPVLDAAFEKFSPRVRLVHKAYPLKQHSHAEGAARAAFAARKQGKFWEMEKALFDHQAELSPSDIDRYARDLKLDPQRFAADMSSPKAGEAIEREKAEADKAGLTGTPFILINGREFDLSYFHLQDDLERWIAVELDLLGASIAR
jgi:protein-disulfide isomerase